MTTHEREEVIGTILSGASTIKATCLLKYEAERGTIQEGMLVVVRSHTKEGKRDFLARVEAIQPVDESYERGSFLTEAIRKGITVPPEISRKFEIAELSLLFGIGKEQREIRYPPLAGDAVVLIKDLKALAPQIFGVKEDDLIIKFGTLIGYKDLPVMLSIEALPMHLAVFGITGSGKSYNIGALIEKLANIKWKDEEGRIITKHFPILAIDPSGDYVDYWDYFIVNGKLGAYPQVVRYVFSMSGIQKALPKGGNKNPMEYIRLFNMDLNEFKGSPRDLAEAIILYSAGDVAGRELQASNLGALLKHMIDFVKIQDLNVLFTNQKLYESLLGLLYAPPRGISIHERTAEAIERQLDTFRRDIVESYPLLGRAQPFTRVTVDELVKKGGMMIVDFTVIGAPGYPLRLKQFIVYYIAYILFKRFVEYKQQEELQRSLLFVIEEAQNYCPNLAEYRIGYSLARDVLQQIATQGRKFGLCFCLITQRPSYVDPVIMSMCNTFLIHRIAPGDEGFVRRVTGGLPESLERKLTRLETGCVIITGQAIKSGLPMLAGIRMGIDRIVEQKAGKVEIAPGLPQETSEG
jgi:DNA helicase HerA-like ATPase